MVNICVICTSRESLEPLSIEHRRVLEMLISTAVNLSELHNLKLLVCSSCLSLIKALAKFRNTAIQGVKHLLYLNQKQLIEPEELLIKGEPPDEDNSIDTVLKMEIEPECPEELLIKGEPPDEDNSIDTVLKMEIEPECVNNLQDGMKSESSESTENWGNIEDVIPKNTIQVTDTNIGKVVKPIAAYPKIKLVRQNQVITAHRLPLRFFNRPPFLPNAYSTLNMPPYPPAKLKPVKVVVIPSLQNMATKRTAPKAVAPKLMEGTKPKPRSDNNNPEMSAAEPAKMRQVKFAVMQSLQNMATKRTAPKPKVMEGTKPKPRSGNNNPEMSAAEVEKSQVTIEPRWYTQVLSYHQTLFQRAKERARPDYADAPYKCKTCILLFGSQEEMETHAKEHVLAPDELPCKVCALPIRPSDEGAHETRHMTRLQCARCAFSTEYLNVMEAHDCSSQPVKKISKLRKRRKYEKTFHCVRCRTFYSDKARLDRHNERAHKTQEEYKCNVCSKEFAGKNQLYLHKRRKHTAKENALDALRPELYCAECNISFPTPGHYRRHRMTRKHCPEGGYKFQCDLCKKVFRSKGLVSRHIQEAHVVEEHVVCTECGKSLPNQLRLHRHMRLHEEKRKRTRPHVCHICGKTFLIKKGIDEHLLSHSGLRPHKCPLCPATFTYSAALFTHNKLKHLKIKGNCNKTKKTTPEKNK